LCLRSDSADCLFSTGTLEHIAEPVAALNEFWRVLKPGGIVHIEVPFMFPYHLDPADYTRWTIDGLRAVCAQQGFTQVRSGVHIGPASALNIALIHYAQCWFEGRLMRRISELVLSVLLRPHMYLDRFLIRRRYAHELACGVYFVGRKSTRAEAASSIARA
jgi:SAM-dependent methyltransferase